MKTEKNKLEEILADKTSKLSDEVKFSIVSRAVREFERSKPQKSNFFRKLFASFNWQPGYTAALCVILVFIFLPYNLKNGIINKAEIQDQKIILSEFQKLFGDNLESVITNNGITKVLLSDGANKKSLPLFINLSVNGKNVEILSFSGENISLNIGDKTINFYALVNGNGKVLLVGDELYWSEENSSGNSSGLKIKARTLEM